MVVNHIMATSVIFVSYLICWSFVVFYGLGTPRIIQERAMVVFFDPKYIRNPQAFTARFRRGDTYRSNFTAEILHPWGNNVTLAVSYKEKYNGNDVVVRGKACELFDIKWLGEFIARHMHIEKRCPFPPGTYGIYNLELPPKGFPLPLPKGEGTLSITFYLDNKKKILQGGVKLNTIH